MAESNKGNGGLSGYGLKIDLTVLGSAATIIFAVGSAWMEFNSRLREATTAVAEIQPDVKSLHVEIAEVQSDITKLKNQVEEISDIRQVLEVGGGTVRDYIQLARDSATRLDQIADVLEAAVICLNQPNCSHVDLPLAFARHPPPEPTLEDTPRCYPAYRIHCRDPAKFFRSEPPRH